MRGASSLTLVFVLAAGLARAEDLAANEISVARKVYVAKCAKCHRFYEPANYSEPDWRRWMTSMSRKSKLKPDQEALLNKYLEAYRAGRVPSPLR